MHVLTMKIIWHDFAWDIELTRIKQNGPYHDDGKTLIPNLFTLMVLATPYNFFVSEWLKESAGTCYHRIPWNEWMFGQLPALAVNDEVQNFRIPFGLLDELVPQTLHFRQVVVDANHIADVLVSYLGVTHFFTYHTLLWVCFAIEIGKEQKNWIFNFGNVFPMFDDKLVLKQKSFSFNDILNLFSILIIEKLQFCLLSTQWKAHSNGQLKLHKTRAGKILRP